MRLPVRVAPAALPAVVRGAFRRRLGRPGLAAALARSVSGAGLTVADVVLAGPGAGPSDLLAAVVVEPSPPELRAAGLDAVQIHPRRPVAVVTARAWEALKRSPAGVAGFGPGDRRALLRAASDGYLHRLDPDGVKMGRAAAAHLRDQLEALGSPVRFPPRPGPDAVPAGVLASALGAFSVVFGGEVAIDPGEPLRERDVAASPPARGADGIAALFDPLLLDVPRHFGEAVRALYLLPGPLGTRRSWQLVAVVADDAPVHAAAALPRRLRQHVAMLDAGAVRGACGGRAAPVVVTESALAGVVRRRLFGRPTRRLAIRRHRRLLLGTDVLATGDAPAFAGPDHVRDDLAAELGSLVAATAACWTRGASGLATTELLFGAWPAVLHLIRTGDPLAPLAAAHEALASSADPAQARTGAAARKLGAALGDPFAADLSRPKALLRDFGPTLVRLQDASFEALG